MSEDGPYFGGHLKLSFVVQGSVTFAAEGDSDAVCWAAVHVLSWVQGQSERAALCGSAPAGVVQ